jgi:hypothetical protein
MEVSMPLVIYDEDFRRADKAVNPHIAYYGESLRNLIARAIVEERERCAIVALEQRCERGTPWDSACVAIAAAIRKL